MCGLKQARMFYKILHYACAYAIISTNHKLGMTLPCCRFSSILLQAMVTNKINLKNEHLKKKSNE